jgi:hypothetical protein
MDKMSNDNAATAMASASRSSPEPSFVSTDSSNQQHLASSSGNILSSRSSPDLDAHKKTNNIKDPLSSDESRDLSFKERSSKFTSGITWKSPFGAENDSDIQDALPSNLNEAPTIRDEPPRRQSRRQKRQRWHLRGYDDDGETDWWFASTAVPLLAATVAPLANVLSIAALVTYWRMDLRDPNDPSTLLVEFSGIPYKDPRWCYWLNVGSLICGFVGNLFLLANFTGRVRYIIALPVTIVLWYIATAIVSLHSSSHFTGY